MDVFIGVLLHLLGVVAVTLPIGYLLQRMEKRHRARMRADLIETYGDKHG